MDSNALKDLLATLRSTQPGVEGDDSTRSVPSSDPASSSSRDPVPPASAASYRPTSAGQHPSQPTFSNQDLSSLLGSLQPVRPPAYTGPVESSQQQSWSPSQAYSDFSAAPPAKRPRLSEPGSADDLGGRRGSGDGLGSPSKARKRDLTQMTYAQALPILSRLVRDRAFMDAVSAVSVLRAFGVKCEVDQSACRCFCR